jgi:hypothetical protein
VEQRAPLDECELQNELFRHYAFMSAARGTLPSARNPAELLKDEKALKATLALDWK